MLNVSAVLVSTGKEMSVDIDMMGAKQEERIDVSGWKTSPFAGDYRSIVRRAEKALKELKRQVGEEAEELARELEELLYQMKKAVIENDLDEADDLEEEIRDLMEEI